MSDRLAFEIQISLTNKYYECNIIEKEICIVKGKELFRNKSDI